MTTSANLRQRLGEAEAFLRGGDPYGAASRAEAAAKRAASIRPDGAELLGQAELALDRFQAARDAMRAEVEWRRALHVENERRAAKISEAASEPEPPRRSWIAALLGRGRGQPEQREAHAVGT
jgi:hypothetical protein